MTATDAAYKVLVSAGEALHYKEIVRRYEVDFGGYVMPARKRTPEVTMKELIGADVRRREERGHTQRFVLMPGGIIGLANPHDQMHKPNIEAKWKPPNRAKGGRAKRTEGTSKYQLLKRAREGTPDDFERLVEALLITMGFVDVARTRNVKDGGIDVRGTLVVGDVVRIRMAVQAKRYRGTVSSTLVQQLRGSLGTHEQGLLITTGRFTKQATAEAARRDASPVALMDGDQLAVLLVKHKDALGLSEFT